MPAILTLSSNLEDAERNKRVFAGDLLIFKNVLKMYELCRFADDLSREAFHPNSPVEAHTHLPWETYIGIVSRLQRQFTNHQTAKKLFKQALIECGVDEGGTYWDWFPLRIQPGSRQNASIATAGYDAHRDTWFANVQAQNNWWGPIYPICENRTMVFYPALFGQSVANDSAGWDLHAFRRARAKVREAGGSDNQVKEAYRFIKVAQELDVSTEVRLVMEPGDLLCFSAAHLHASIPNLTPVARFSTEVRTVNIDCVLRGKGALKVDGDGTGYSYEDFHNLRDGKPLLPSLPMELGSESML